MHTRTHTHTRPTPAETGGRQNPAVAKALLDPCRRPRAQLSRTQSSLKEIFVLGGEARADDLNEPQFLPDPLGRPGVSTPGWVSSERLGDCRVPGPLATLALGAVPGPLSRSAGRSLSLDEPPALPPGCPGLLGVSASLSLRCSPENSTSWQKAQPCSSWRRCAGGAECAGLGTCMCEVWAPSAQDASQSRKKPHGLMSARAPGHEHCSCL